MVAVLFLLVSLRLVNAGERERDRGCGLRDFGAEHIDEGQLWRQVLLEGER